MNDNTYAGRTLAEIKAAAEAAPNWDWYSNQTPFYNDPDGFSRGGNCDGTYSVFGEPFEIEGEQYDGKVLIDRCWKDEATFICEAKPAILAMAARIEELERELAEARHANTHAGLRSMYQRAMSECDDALRLVAEVRHACGDDGKRMLPELVQYVGELAKDAARYRKVRRGQQWSVVDGTGNELRGDVLDAAIDAAMEQTKNREGHDE